MSGSWPGGLSHVDLLHGPGPLRLPLAAANQVSFPNQLQSSALSNLMLLGDLKIR